MQADYEFNFMRQFSGILAPAYDITYSDTYWGEHTTSVNGKGKDISKNDIVKTGTDAGLSKEFCIDCYDDTNAKIRVLEPYLNPCCLRLNVFFLLVFLKI